MAVGLEGNRNVEFFTPDGPVKVEGDYLATGGLHVDTEHQVKTNGYTLSVTSRQQKSKRRRKGTRQLGLLMRPQANADANMDPQVLSEVRQEMNEAMEGQALMTSKLKEALNRIFATSWRLLASQRRS